MSPWRALGCHVRRIVGRNRMRGGWWRAALLLPLAVALDGCANLGYYAQSIGGHLHIMAEARPVGQLLDDDATSAELKRRLILSQRIRDFAVTELKLPDNDSYRRYADLKRGAVVWNVVAAPADSLELRRWCFVLAGCVSYRGYFHHPDALALAQQLRAQGMDVAVLPVPAYSTLGWLNWLGGDPLLNTFIAFPEGELARLIFHELAHQVAYAADDSTFNESFATMVEQLGAERWLSAHGSAAARHEYDVLTQRRRQFGELMQRTRDELAGVYRSDAGDAMRTHKAQVMARFRSRYEALRRTWGDYRGYDAVAAQANNALFGVYATYDELVPEFTALFERGGRDWARFFETVRRLAAEPRDERRQHLRELAGGQIAARPMHAP